MALVQAVENGQIVESASQASLSKANQSSDGMDKEAFLQLLVAQMQYQDPLEPTSNTEYISQYAQFSQVEALQNMAGSMDLMRASTLVGQEVYVKTVSSNGDVNYVRGKVDYVVYENGKAYVSINEALYALEDVDTIADSEYIAAYDKALEFNYRINKLPNIHSVDLTNAEEIDELEEIYNNMTDYEKSFIASSVVSTLNKYIEKLKEVRAAAESQKGGSDETPEVGDVEDGDGEDVGDVEGGENAGEPEEEGGEDTEAGNGEATE